MSVIFIDTETTNLLAVEAADLVNQPHVVEICCIKTNIWLEKPTVLSVLVKPPIRIPDEVIKIHHITNEDVQNKKPFAGHYHELAAFFLGATHLVGHNLQFDKRILENELKRINKLTQFPWPVNNICTVEEIRKIKGHRMSLGDLHEELFGVRFEEAHRAEADTQALVRVFKAMVEKDMLSYDPR
jgi:DNA polymerase III epsilon subunit-like protein